MLRAFLISYSMELQENSKGNLALKMFFVCLLKREWGGGERESTSRRRDRGRNRLPAEQGALHGTQSQEFGIMV